MSGNPVPLPSDIQWYRNDVLIDDMDSSLTLSIDRTMLTISNIMGDYYGIYQCKVTTSAGTRYHNITITQPRKCYDLCSINTLETCYSWSPVYSDHPSKLVNLTTPQLGTVQQSTSLVHLCAPAYL